jgi:hypothetical protein
MGERGSGSIAGLPSSYAQDSDTTFDIYQRMYFLFVQDDWKVSRKLTLNLGVRYEFATPPRERNNKWANFDSSKGAFVSAKDGGLFEQALIHPDRNNFAPRVGFAYSMTPKTVIRGGYGIFYNHANRLGREGLLGFNPPFIILGNASIAGSGTLRSDGCAVPFAGWGSAGVSSISTGSTCRPFPGRRRIHFSERRMYSNTTSGSSRRSSRTWCST